MSLRYGYGHSTPQINYHQQNTEYVTTVIKEMSRMTMNQKPSSFVGGVIGDVHKNKVCKEEVMIEDNNCGGYKEESADSYSGFHSGGGAAKEKYAEYHKEEAFDGYGNGAAVKNNTHGAYGDAGYAASHYGGSDMHKYGYQKDTYGKADAAAGGYYGGGHYDVGYGKADACHFGGGGAKQTNSYSKQQAAYGGGAITGAVQQHGYYQDAYDHADAAAGGYGGGAYYGDDAMQAYDAGGYNKQQKAGFGGGAMMQKHGYNKQDVYGGGYHGGAAGGGYNYNYNKAHGHAGKTEFAGGHQYEAYESDYESDREEEAFGHQHGGAYHGGGTGMHSYEAYKREGKHGGGGNLGGGVHRYDYEAYERRENLGGGHRYESYKAATHEGYAAGGAGYGACAPPRKNHFFC